MREVSIESATARPLLLEVRASLRARLGQKADPFARLSTRECQVAHYKAHKPTCGVDLAVPTQTSIATSLLDRDPSSATTTTKGGFVPPEALLFHLAALGTLPPSAWPAGSSPPSFLFFPTPPVHKAADGQSAAEAADASAVSDGQRDAADEENDQSGEAVAASNEASGSKSAPSEPPTPDFIPIVLPAPARNLFNCIQLVAYETANPISVNLMYSVLLDEVAALGGAEPRLVDQLASEYRLDDESVRKAKEQAATAGGDADDDEDAGEGEKKRRSRFRTLREVIDDESEPSVEELFDAIGGQKNTRILVDWQVYESERKRTVRQQQEQKNKGRKGGRKGRR